MSPPVLFVSRDHLLLSSRTSFLRRAGFMTLRVQNLAVLASMARFADFRTVVLDHTISPVEQQTVIRKLHEFSSLFHIICIGTRDVSSEAIVRECEACNRDHHRGGTHVLQVGPVLLP